MVDENELRDLVARAESAIAQLQGLLERLEEEWPDQEAINKLTRALEDWPGMDAVNKLDMAVRQYRNQ